MNILKYVVKEKNKFFSEFWAPTIRDVFMQNEQTTNEYF
jgi:hypothetical protein